MSVQGSLNVALALTQTAGSQPTVSSARDLIARTLQIEIANGTGSGQADRVYRASPSISAAANLDLDLIGALEDAFGAAVTFAKVKHILVRNTSATGTLSLKPGASAAWVALLATGSEVIIPANGFALFGTETGNGIAVTAGADVLRITNNAATATIPEIIIIGASA